MKITIEQYEHTVTHEVPHNDVDLDEAVRMIEGLLRAIGYHFSGNLEIVDDSVEEESFRIVDEPNESKIRVGDATITTYDEFGVKHEMITKQQEQ
jgi:hypothetical protein